MRLPALTDDWTLKLFSLAVALVLFVLVSVESDTPIDVAFRIEYRTADDMIITGQAPEILHSTLRGPWASLRSFELDSLPPLVVDLTKSEPGEIAYRIDAADVDAPAGMQVISIRPAQVDITLDRKIERQIPVFIDVTERPALGFEILSATADPPRVRVVGPMTKMRALDFINTRPVDVSGREEDLILDVDLRTPPTPLRLKEKRVKVTIEVREEFVERQFESVPVKLESAPPGTQVSPKTATLTLRGPRRLLDKMTIDDIDAFARPDTQEGSPRTAEKSVELRNLPPRTQLVGFAPKVVIRLPRHRR